MEEGCKEIVDRSTFALLGEEYATKYDTFLVKKALSKNTASKLMLRCPSPECSLILESILDLS